VIQQLVSEDNDASLEELRERFAARVGAVSLATIGRVVLRLGLTRKERLSMPPSERPIE
jgi:arginine repressor